MEYVPRNANPYVSRVDAGTIELVKSFGVEIVSSGDLVQVFEASWDDEQWAMHLEAAKHTRSAYDVAFAFIAEQIQRTRSRAGNRGASSASWSISRSTAWSPIIRRSSAQGPHSGDPHYAPGPAPTRQSRRAISSSSICGPSSTSRAPSTAT